MKTKLLTSLLAIHTILSTCVSQEFEYEVPVVVTRRGANEPLAEVKVGPVAYFDSHVYGVEPGHTDSQGKAIVRFRSSKSKLQVNYRVIQGPDGEAWCLKFHGFFPNGSAFLPPHNPSAKPVDVPTLVMEAYPADESAQIAIDELTAGRSEMMGAAMAAALTVPPPGTGGPGDIQLIDPLKSHETVAKLLQTTPGQAKDLVARWQALVDIAPSDQKLDEKSLSALVKGDMENAAEFAAKAEILNSQGVGAHVFVSDTKQLIETVYQFNIAAQDNQEAFPSSTADNALKMIETKIKPLRPVRDGRFPASIYDSSDIEIFTEKVREQAAILE